MKKRKNTMLALLVILAVLIVCYFVIGKIQENQEEEPAEEATYAVSMDDIVSIKYSDGTSTMTFTKTDDTWSYEEDTTVALEQSTMESMADTFGKIIANRTLEEPDALSDYGLEESAYTIELADKEGNVTTVYIGNQTGSDYYLTVGDKKVVYTVSSSVVNAMEFDVEELREASEESEGETGDETGDETSEDADTEDSEQN